MIGKYIINRGDFTHPTYHKSYLNKVYKIDNLYILQKSTENFEINKETIPYSKGNFKGYVDGIGIEKLEKLDFSNPEIAKIYSFYEVLNGLDTKIENKFLGTIYADKVSFEFQGSIEMGSYGVSNRGNKENYVYFSYSDEEEWNLNLPIPTVYEGIRGSRITYKEFFLLMQIYFGLYQNEELKKQLEENERNGKYDEIRKNLDYKKFCEENKEYVEKYNKELQELRKSKQDWTIGKKIKIEDYFIEKELSKPEVKEYLELELMRKDTTGAFGGLKIEKIYDKNWSKEKQKERIEEINKEFGEEVVVVE